MNCTIDYNLDETIDHTDDNLTELHLLLDMYIQAHDWFMVQSIQYRIDNILKGI